MLSRTADVAYHVKNQLIAPSPSRVLAPCVDDLCCDGKPYDYVNLICCNEELLPRPPNGQCCGREAYNELTHICCGMQVEQIANNDYLKISYQF